MKKQLEITISRKHPAAILGMLLMLSAAVIRLIYYLSKPYNTVDTIVLLILPVLAAGLYVAGVLLEGKRGIQLTVGAVFIGVCFFILKAFLTFTPLHRNLCTILYITVILLYALTALGYLPTKKLLYPLFALPLLYHIFVEDTRDYLFADPPVPYFDWLPEISVLAIIAALLCSSIAMKAEKIDQ